MKEMAMFRLPLWLSMFVLLVMSACSVVIRSTEEEGGGPPTPAEVVVTQELVLSEVPQTEESPEPPVTEMPLIDPPMGETFFEAELYRNENIGIEFKYPAAWEIIDLGTLGDRGSGIQFSADGELMMNVTLLRWDPINDLEAFAQTRKMAWGASGFVLELEELVTLSSGQAAYRFIVRTPDGEQAVFFLAELGERYLEMNGVANVDELVEITGTLRLLQP
jgi:hypothetical protein